MGIASERGEGKLGSIIWLLILVAMVWAAFRVFPVYYANYSFQDKVVELARAPKYSHSDERIITELKRAAQEYKLEGYINEKSCAINTMEVRRTIVCTYQRQVEILPGIKHTFRFKNEGDQPLI